MSNKPNSNLKGRQPLSTKTEASDFTHDDFDFNLLKIDPELKAELEGQGFSYRWINKKTYVDRGNNHRTGWKAYKKQASESRGSIDFDYGISPEGYVVRGDLILAVKPKAAQDAYRQHIRAKTERQSAVARRQAQQLRQMAGHEGIKITSEGSDDQDFDE
jgi:hypothetical protein